MGFYKNKFKTYLQIGGTDTEVPNFMCLMSEIAKKMGKSPTELVAGIASGTLTVPQSVVKNAGTSCISAGKFRLKSELIRIMNKEVRPKLEKKYGKASPFWINVKLIAEGQKPIPKAEKKKYEKKAPKPASSIVMGT